MLYNKHKKSINSIDASEKDYLYIYTSQIPKAGNGLYTSIDIFKEEVISYFYGEIISLNKAKSRADKMEDLYFINLLNGRTLDCMYTDCYAKYANDANGIQNSVFKNNAKITLDENNAVCLVALRKIKAGEEIFCSYGKKYWLKHAR